MPGFIAGVSSQSRENPQNTMQKAGASFEDSGFTVCYSAFPNLFKGK